MVEMIRQKRKRAAAYAVPAWWHEQAVSAYRASGWSMAETAARLTSAAARDQPWNHSIVSKFLAKTYVTEELVNAFVLVFDLPLPVYHPRDMSEALAFKQAASTRRVSDEESVPGADEHDLDARRSQVRDRVRKSTERLRNQAKAGTIPTGANGHPREPQAGALVPTRPAGRRG